MSTKITEEHFKQEVEELMARIDASREKHASADKSSVNISSFYYRDYPSLKVTHYRQPRAASFLKGGEQVM